MANVLKGYNRCRQRLAGVKEHKREVGEMDYAAILDVFTRYGAIAIFVLVFLEYMNLPGFPAGIIMPLAGIMAAGGNISFPWVMVITVAAGLLGSLVLYVLGFTGGRFFLEKYMNKFPKQRPRIEKYLAWVQEKGGMGLIAAKLIPMIRTLVSIPAGVFRMRMDQYVICSTIGIFIWNLFFVGAGYFCGEQVLSWFA